MNVLHELVEAVLIIAEVVKGVGRLEVVFLVRGQNHDHAVAR